MDPAGASSIGFGSVGRSRRIHGCRKKVASILVTTSHPTNSSTTSTTTTASSMGGALTVLCPLSGMIQSSTRIHGGDFHNSAATASSNYTTKGQVGVSHISFFPNPTHRVDTREASLLAMAYGSSTDKKNDAYGMLVAIRSGTAFSAAIPPYIHWKCRLPESNMSGGLLVSPVTSHHVIGGGHSGSLYVWNTLQNGALIRTIPSVHYRAITCMMWSSHSAGNNTVANPWNSLLITAGADGMIHCFSQLDLLQTTDGTGTGSKIHPIRSWTKHSLPVTSLVSMTSGSGRIVSSGDDGLLVIMELSSGATIATIQLPNPIKTLQMNEHHNRLFAGSNKGIIYIIDTDAYVLHTAVQMGASILQIPNDQLRPEISIEEQVFGMDENNLESSTTTTNSTPNLPRQSELRGHDRAVTALAIFDNDDNDECLISGDEMGIVRIWDTRRGCCLRVIYPWSSSGTTTTSTGKISSSNIHPVTAIHIIRDTGDPFHGNDMEFGDTTVSMFSTSGTTNLDHHKHHHKRKRTLNYASMIAPLQKFSNDGNSNSETETSISIPFLQPRNADVSSNFFYDVSSGNEIISNALQFYRRKLRTGVDDRTKLTETTFDTIVSEKGNDEEEGNDSMIKEVEANATSTTTLTVKISEDSEKVSLLNTEIERLKQELDVAKQTVSRWELVNNKLMERINTATGTPQE